MADPITADQPNAPLVLTLVANALLLLEGRADDDDAVISAVFLWIGAAAACDVCGDSLEAHIGNKPCVVGATATERRQRYVRDQEAKRNLRLFGEEPERPRDRLGCPNCHKFARHGYAPGCVAGKGNSGRRNKKESS